MVEQLTKWLAALLFILLLCFVFYELGKSNAKIEIVTKEVEVVKYVAKERAKIQAKPNAGRDELLGLMQSGKL